MGAKLGIFEKRKIVLSGSTMYTIVVVYEDGKYNDADYKKFIDSFELKNPAIEKLLQEIPPPDQLRQK